MDLSVNCVTKSWRKTPPRKEKHEFLPKSSSKIENKIKFYIKNKLTCFFFIADLGSWEVGCPRPG